MKEETWGIRNQGGFVPLYRLTPDRSRCARMLEQPLRDDGVGLLSPDLVEAVERGSLLGTKAHPKSALGLAVREVRELLEKARWPRRQAGGYTSRRRLERDGFRFGEGGEIWHDPALIENHPLGPQPSQPRSLTPGRRPPERQDPLQLARLRDKLLAAITGLMEAPFNRLELRNAEITLIVSRLPDLDRQALAAVKSLAELERDDAKDAAGMIRDMVTRIVYSGQAEDAEEIVQAVELEVARRKDVPISTRRKPKA